MKKLLKGIIEFRTNVLEGYRETFAKLALEQSPDTLFIACSDSRVVPNLFASTNPGDLFVLRNVGNLIAPCGLHGFSSGDESEAAAVEIALSSLHVSNIVVCGHSECAAMKAIDTGRDRVQAPNLRNWLRHGEPAQQQFKDVVITPNSMNSYNKLSQYNVLLQIEHIKTYPIVQKFLKQGMLGIHAWWFDIAKADVYAYEEDRRQFVIIDDAEAERIIARLK